MGVTTIQVKDSTLERLRSLKDYSRESYDEIINNLIDEIGEGELTDEVIDGIKRGLDDIRNKRTKPIEEVAKEFGIRLK